MDPAERAVHIWLERAHTLWQLTEKPRIHLQEMCTCEAHTLDQRNCGCAPCPLEGEVPVSVLGMCTVGWICMASSCLQRCLGAVCWGTGLRGPVY